MCRIATFAIGLLALVGCQSGPGNRSSASGSHQDMPGEIVRKNYNYILEAIAFFESALSGKNADFSQVSLVHALDESSVQDTSRVVDKLIELAETELVADGPYKLVNADTSNGRLEYESLPTGQRISITVRSPTVAEKSNSNVFIVTDIFSQVSLADLYGADSFKSKQKSSPSSVLYPSLSEAVKIDSRDDTSVLAYFNSLPIVERDRLDILSLRALLLMRLGNDQQASPLVEQGVVRYPDASIFLVMAANLFERANSKGGVPEALSTLMQVRFNSKEIIAARENVQDLLNRPVLF